MQRRQFLQTATATAAVASLAGCGFQLRGKQAMPFDSVYIQGQDTQFTRILKQELQRQSKLVASPALAQVVLQVLTEKQEQFSSIVDGNQQVAQVQLRFIAQVAMVASNGTPMMEPVTIRAVREVSYSDSQALSKQSEFAMLYSELRRDVASQVLRRMAYARPLA